MDRGQEVESSTAVAVAEDGCLGAFLLVADELATTRQTRLHPETFRTKGLEPFSLTLVQVPNPHASTHVHVDLNTTQQKQWSFFLLALPFSSRASRRQVNTTLFVSPARHVAKELFSALASVGRRPAS